MQLDLSPLFISLRASLLATFITFLLGIAAAYAVTRYRGRFKGVIDGILTLPLVLPPTVVGFFLWDTIAKTSDKVRVAEIAPANSHQPVSVPAAIVGASKNSDAANQFLQYLKSDEAMKVFEKYGFKKP